MVLIIHLSQDIDITEETSPPRKRHYTAPACTLCFINLFQFYIPTNPSASPRRGWGSG